MFLQKKGSEKVTIQKLQYNGKSVKELFGPLSSKSAFPNGESRFSYIPYRVLE